MVRKARRALAVSAFCLLSTLLACEEPPEAIITDAAAPTLDRRLPIVVAPLALGTAVSAELSLASPNYQFSFALTAPASVSLRTQADGDAGVVDTVITLSRIDQYGLPRPIGTSDDFDHTKFSGLDRTLSKGAYRLSVRGATLAAHGPFVLTSSCSGKGCPALPAVCLFGDQFSDLRTSSQVDVLSEVWITSASQVTTAVLRDQLVLALQQSSHTDVTTPEEALAAADQNEIRHMEIMEHGGTRAFTVLEYGAGDNSYGAIFDEGTLTLAASIHDGDFANCVVSP